MRLPVFGRHLHNQIVVPLLVVSACVAIVATFVGVFYLQTLIESWVSGNAAQASQTVETQFGETARRLALDARLVADRAPIDQAAASGDWAPVQQQLETVLPALLVDDVAVVDGAGTVLASAGATALEPGVTLLGDATDRILGDGRDTGAIAQLGGRDAIIGLHQVVPAAQGARGYAVVVGRRIDATFLGASFPGVASAVGYAGPSGALRAAFVDRATVSAENESEAAAEHAELTRALAGAEGSVVEAIAKPGESVTLRTKSGEYTVRASRLTLGPSVAAGTSATSADGYVVVVVSNAVAAYAGRATAGLIAFWSVVAVIVLTGLGTIIARQVSAPLSTISESARRVADGDFAARVEFQGVNEVADLAESFNAMTESLRERTESLTKKVLELATLYEMSRALGSTLDLDVLLDSVLDSALRIFNVDAGYVMLRDKVTGSLDLRAWRGMSGVRPDDRVVRSSMSDWVVRQGRPLIFNPPQDAEGEERIDAVTGALAALCVPLVSSEGVIGSICVGSRDAEYRFSSDDVRLLSTIANHVTIAIGNIELFSSLQEAYLATVRSLAAAVDAKDPFTRGHSDRVALYAKAIAERLELSSEQCIALEMAAYLHDIGKIGIREAILLKPGKLDAEEMGQMRHHPLIGANILKPVAFPWPIAPVVRHHHEHFDGAGYPAGLKGEEIPLLARILTVADAFEAMTADRPYRLGRDHDEAIAELRRCADSHFDPRVVDAFVTALEDIEDQAAARRARAVEEIQPEEARAIFVAVCDGMFASFRRLGGPRLASNLEGQVGQYFAASELPYALHNGHLTVDWDRAGTPERQIEEMREVLRHIAAGMEATAGRSLVDHFYDEAVSALSDRMRYLAQVLDLYAQE